MKRILLITLLFAPLFAFSQVNEITFNHQRINFSAAPRSTLNPMSIKMWDNYNNGGPSTYGTVLEFYGFGSHQTGQLYFGGWDNSKIRYREAFYAQNTWSEWMTLLDSKNDVESGGSLKISGAGNHYILNGNVGIGTNNPLAQIHLASDVDHSFLISRVNGTYGFRINRNAQQGNVYFQIATGLNTWETKIKIGEGEGTNTKLIFNPDGGNVLIGKTFQPSTGTRYKLDVEGPIRAHEIVVNTTGADFVFEPTYKLRTLAELETFIRTNKHLPDIAPAKEMQENGVSAGEMQTKLLQKVEELTLYVIEQEKKNTKLQTQLNAQKEEIAQLKQLIK